MYIYYMFYRCLARFALGGRARPAASQRLGEAILRRKPAWMKITVEIPDSEVKEICRVTGERKKCPAIRKLVADALLLKRREQLVQKFIDGERGVELKGFEAGQAADREADRQGERSGTR